MRISTASIYNNALSALLDRQSQVSKTQNEVATGLRVQKPSDDPVAAVKILQLQQQTLANTQYGTNIAAATTRLNQEEQALADSGTVLQRVHELTIQANSAVLGNTDRTAIIAELTQLNQQLIDVGNRKDANGEFLFAGLSTATQPFARDASNNVVYSGDAGTRSLQTDAAQYVQDGDSGYAVFQTILQGNGTFVTGASASNTGTGIITSSLQNPALWVPGDYTLSFTSPTDWQITDSNAVSLASGSNYIAGTAITFNGAQISVSGAAAAGDSFTINRSRNEDLFKTIDTLITVIGTTPQGTDAGKAQFQNQVGRALQQLDQAESHFLNVRTSVGARLSALQNVETTRQDAAVSIQGSLSSIRDSDYADAISRLSQQTLGLQAAQQSYVKIANLSLFDYLR